MMMSMETFFVASHFFRRMEENCTFAKKYQNFSVHFDCTCCYIARSWICVDVQRCIAHITYIVEMTTVENSTYQVPVVDNVHSSSHLTRNLIGCYAYLFLSKLIYIDLCVGMYCNWVIYVTEYHKGCPVIGCMPYDLRYVSTS